MSRPELGPIAAGNKVFVVDPRFRVVPITARVVKVNRVWIDIESAEVVETRDGHRPCRTWRMRKDTQYETAGPNPRGARFLTPAQHEYDERLFAANLVLCEEGITIHRNSPWSSAERRIQLADLLAAASAD